MEQIPTRGAFFSGRINELDGLRGLGILMVLFRHYLWTSQHSPWILNRVTVLFDSALDLFFMLSGILLGGILIENKSAKNYFAVFYWRRFLRIWPLYLLLICLYLVIKYGGGVERFHFQTYFKDHVSIKYYLLFVQNIVFEKYRICGPAFLVVTWSLAVEEQFYLCLPWIIRIVRLSILPYACLAFALFAPLFRAGMYLWDPAKVMPHFNGPNSILSPSRCDSFFLGVLMAYILNKRGMPFIEKHRIAFGGFLMIFGLGMVILTPLRLFDNWPSIYIFAPSWISLFYFFLIINALIDQGYIKAFFRMPALCYVGMISYFVYLFHFPVLFFLHSILLHRDTPSPMDIKGLAVTLLSFATTLFLAALSWRFIEKPLIRLGHNFKYQTVKSAE